MQSQECPVFSVVEEVPYSRNEGGGVRVRYKLRQGNMQLSVCHKRQHEDETSISDHYRVYSPLAYLFIKFQPSVISFAVQILEPKVPDFS